MTSHQQHHYPYNHTSSCRCHEDRRLRLYASDCLSGALFPECTRPTADSGVFMCAVTRQLAASGQGRVAVRLLCETWNRFGPPPSQALRQYSLLFLIRGSYCSSAQNLCGHFSWSHACYFFFKGSSLWSSAHDSSLILSQRNAFVLRRREALTDEEEFEMLMTGATSV